MDMSYSADLKEIPDLSKAINVKELKLWGCSSLVALHSSIGNLSKMYGLRLSGCTSLVTLPSSIGNLSKLSELDMSKCSNLNFLPADVDLESLEVLNLNGCSKLRTFPRISRNIRSLYLEETALEGEEDSSWIENIPHLKELYWDDVPLSCMPTNFNPEDMEYLVMSSGRLKKLWGGVKSLGKLWGMHLSGCESLVEIPDLSMAIGLRYLELKNCKSLVMLPSSIRNLYQLKRLNMEGCTMLEALPVDINLGTLKELYLSGCSKLRIFPQISTSIVLLYLDDTVIEEVPSWIKNMSRLKKLTMRRCKNLKNISAEIFKLECDKADFSDCGGITTICDHLPGRPHNDVFDMSSYISFRFPQVAPFKFHNCFNLDQDAQEIIIQSYRNMAVIPGGEVPMYFMHRACGSSLSILLSESSLSQESILLKTCIVVGPSRHYPARLTVRQSFRGQKEEIPCDVVVDTCTYEMDHLVLFILHLQIKRVDDSPSEPNNNVLLLEFYKSHYDGYYEGCSCGSSFGGHKQNSTLEEIKGCGARVMNISKTDDEESDEESNRSKKKMRVSFIIY
ncbi:hypothetical protein F2Q68_00011993 [Brassica cretica]|uniref:C-JID domain-containing protein n=1 Tax=Brassica cretica TaxID=69181 RepID=A0A8S9KQQ6_BRACR|nr:hypothetical protein F2Q68_00011993 [Brassica cretica]